MPERKKRPQKIEIINVEDDRVRLKPFLGIRPGYYLALLYGLIILIILFLILIYPGLNNPGTMFSVSSNPSGAAVRVGGVYMDTTPCSIFIPQGRHRIEVVLPGFNDWQRDLDFGGSIFASIFLPLKGSLRVELEAPSPREAFIREGAEFIAWSFAGESTIVHHIPPVLSEGAYRLGPWASDPLSREGMDETLAAVTRFANSRSSLRDLLRAKFLLDNQGLSPSPLTLLHSTEEIIAFLGENSGTATWLADLLQGEAASQVASSQWYDENRAWGEGIWASLGSEIISFGGLRFREFIPWEFIHREILPAESMDVFYIAESPIGIEIWELFLDERPEWRIENLEQLINEGLVNSQYLAVSDLPGLPENTMAWISWYAARAWCEWYSSRLPPPLHVRLPYEAEWELAAKSGLNRVGDFWEWCEDLFIPLDFLPPAPAVSDPGSPERPVRGGSWINRRQNLEIEIRASLPPDSCSPFVSFRPVLVSQRD